MLRVTPLSSGWQTAAKSWLVEPRKLGFSALDWIDARVPGHVHGDLVRHGIIADPFTDQHELGVVWVDEEDWSYRCEFDFEPDASRPVRVLRFAGLDTVAAVHLNGKLVARHDNMFVPLEIDVSKRLRAGKNQLLVELASATRTGRERRARYFSKHGLPPDCERFDERAFVRKAQYMFGWDWGPRLVSAGLWGNVELLEYQARLLDVHSRQVHAPDGSVQLVFESQVDGNGEVLHYVDGKAEPVRDGELLRIRRPELWWPAGLGEQRLYHVESYLVPKGTASRRAAREAALDRREFAVGLRRIELVRDPDEHGESFEFRVNGRALYAVGANWIPDHSFPSVVARKRVREQLGRARDMNMNMLRVWGGGLYESEDFYEACDELGLLVWQDFPFACGYYPDDAEARAVAKREASEAIRRLRNHASLALWCGNNENLQMFQDKWGRREAHPPRYYGELIYERVLPRVLAELDPERPYIPSSPWGGERANGGGFGDQHYWDVWHGRGDWKHYDDSTARFGSEFGFAAAPGHAAWRRMSTAKEPLALDVRHPTARWHDKTAKGYETFVSYVELHYPRAQNIEEWTYFSQLNQRDALRHGIEHYRRSEYCKGSLIWQLNDCWPVQSWAVVDSEGVYKAAAFELRRLYAPALLSVVVVAGGQGTVWGVLDNADAPLRADVVLEARSLRDGRVLDSKRERVTLRPGERRPLLRLDVSRFDPRSTLLVARGFDTLTYRLLAEPKDVSLREPRLAFHAARGKLTLESDVPVVDLFVWDELGCLDLEENFVTLPQPGRVTLSVRGTVGRLAARSLRGRHRLGDVGAVSRSSGRARK